MRKTKTIQLEQGTAEKCERVKPSMGGLRHLPEKQFDKLIEEEPEITIKGYLLFLREIADIEKSTENGIEGND